MVFHKFPKLSAEGYQVTSPINNSYNCVAHAADDYTRWWEPNNPDTYWPSIPLQESTIRGVMAAFESLGYEECDTADYEPDHERVALYGRADDDPTHTAKQVGQNLWSSKLGEAQDISHTLEGLVGDEYGIVMRFMRRRRALAG